MIRGNHRDAWTDAAVDRNSLTSLLDISWQMNLLHTCVVGGPCRTILLCSCDGEELGMVGYQL